VGPLNHFVFARGADFDRAGGRGRAILQLHIGTPEIGIYATNQRNSKQNVMFGPLLSMWCIFCPINWCHIKTGQKKTAYMDAVHFLLQPVSP
jgi:hypothetical protein